MTAVEWLHQFDPDASRQDIHGLLGQMLFSGEEGLKPTDALSGGETARLLFCRIMLQKPNVLILDEPTNHLDLEVDQRAEHRAAEIRGHGSARHPRSGSARRGRHARVAVRERQDRRLQGNLRGADGIAERKHRLSFGVAAPPRPAPAACRDLSFRESRSLPSRDIPQASAASRRPLQAGSNSTRSLTTP